MSSESLRVLIDFDITLICCARHHLLDQPFFIRSAAKTTRPNMLQMGSDFSLANLGSQVSLQRTKEPLKDISGSVLSHMRKAV